MQTPSSLSQSVIKAMRKAVLETCRHHGNVVITTSPVPNGKNLILPWILPLSPPSGFRFPLVFIRCVFLFLSSSSPWFCSPSFSIPFVHLLLCFGALLSQLYASPTFPLITFQPAFLLLHYHSTSSIYYKLFHVKRRRQTWQQDRPKDSWEDLNWRRCKDIVWKDRIINAEEVFRAKSRFSVHPI